MRARALACASLLLVFCETGVHSRMAYAEPTAQASEGARREARARAEFERGVHASEAGQWHTAEGAFAASLAQAEKPSTRFNYALALLRNGDPVAALASFDTFEHSADKSLHGELLTRTRTLRAEARASAAELRVRALEASLHAHTDGPAQWPAQPRNPARAAWLGSAGVLGAGALGALAWWIERSDERGDCRRPGGVRCLEEAQIERRYRAAFGATLTFAVGALGSAAVGLFVIKRAPRASLALATDGNTLLLRGRY